jgi:hypothetical protein
MTDPERICRDCEYFDRHYGDCLNRLSPRFQTTADQTCAAFYPDSSCWSSALVDQALKAKR